LRTFVTNDTYLISSLSRMNKSTLTGFTIRSLDYFRYDSCCRCVKVSVVPT